MKYLIALLVSTGILHAQDFKTSSETFVNGISGPMQGVPGDVFTSVTKFTNLTTDSINIAMSRYKNNLPSYWALCYCYIQCYSPADDNIVIQLGAFESADVTLLFKTDSVNPGKAEAAFTIQQIGSSALSHMTLNASTMPNTVGMSANSELAPQLKVFPNPAQNEIQISLGGLGTATASIYSTTGQLVKGDILINSSTEVIAIDMMPSGVYLLTVRFTGKELRTHFIKR